MRLIAFLRKLYSADSKVGAMVSNAFKGIDYIKNSIPFSMLHSPLCILFACIPRSFGIQIVYYLFKRFDGFANSTSSSVNAF